MTSDLSRIYNEFAATYDENRGMFEMTEVLDGFFEQLDPESGLALDLGCGAGEPFAAAFLRRGWSVVGVDFSARMLELARRYAPGMQTVQGDMRQVAFAPERFDAVTIIYALFHIPANEQTGVLEKVHRWLRPGGRALFTYAGREYTGKPEFDGYKEFMGRRLYYAHKTPEALREDLARIGFQIEAEDYRDIGGEVFLWFTVHKTAG